MRKRKYLTQSIKRAIQEQMRDLGLWEDFVRIRDKHKTEGTLPQEAYYLAYFQLADEGHIKKEDELLDRSINEGGSKGSDDPEKDADGEDEEDNTVDPGLLEGDLGMATDEDFIWAYNALGSSRISRDKAPSPGAYGLWKHSRSNQQVMKLIIDRVTEKKKDDEEEDISDLELTGIAEKLRSRFGEISEQITQLCRCA